MPSQDMSVWKWHKVFPLGWNMAAVEKLEKEIENKAQSFLKARNLGFISVENGKLLIASDQGTIWPLIWEDYPAKGVQRELEEEGTGCSYSA